VLGTGIANDSSWNDFISADYALEALAEHKIEQLAMGDDFTCVLVRPEQKVYCYGANDQGQLGAGGDLDEYEVDPVPLKFEEPVFAIQVEGDFACLIRSMDKSLWCWGAVPVLVGSYSSPQEFYDVKGVSKMALGADRGCVLFLDDTIQCFRESFTESSTTPLKDIEVTLSEGEKVVDLKFRNAHCCVLLNNGRIMCFGYNGNGQLGDGTTTDRYDKASYVDGIDGTTPSKTARHIALGAQYTCALMVNDEVYCWGFGYAGAFSSNTPILLTEFQALEDIHSIEAGLSATMAILNDGKVYCVGQCPDGDTGGFKNTVTLKLIGDVLQ